jgi:hypothetical protein
LAVAALAVLAALGFLISNLVVHSLHQAQKVPVTTSVISVKALSPTESEITASVSSSSSQAGQVSCLVGVEMPSTPLAFPIRVTEQLTAHQTKTITVTRVLLKPYAAQVTTRDVAFTCT